MSDAPGEAELRDELRQYYGPLLPIWDRTLENRGDLAMWRRVARRWEDRCVLEVGAGSGRVTRCLAGPARQVVGIDLNPDALARARSRLSGFPGVHLVLADMRTFALDRRFPAVAAANDPFSHLRSDAGRDAALRRISHHLAPGGEFVLDTLWFPEEWREEAAGPSGKTMRQTVRAGDEESEELEMRHTWRCDPSSARCTARFECRGEEGVRARSVFVGRYWTRPELEARLDAAGMRIRELWGDYDRSEWTPGSPHLVVRAGPR